MRRKIKNTRFVVALFVIIMGFILTFSCCIFMENNKKIVVILNGNEYQKLSLNSSYKDEGFKVTLNNQEVSLDKIDYKVSDDINELVLGKYEVNYEINYQNKEYKLKRVVEVVDDISPTLTISQEYAEKYTCKKTDKMNLDYVAEDNYDGIITDKVKVDVLNDKVILSVKDSSNNETKKEIPLKEIHDESVSIMNLNGRDIVYLAVNEEYMEEGAYIIDGCGKKITDNLEISGSVDTSKSGEYTISYKYLADNTLNKTRKVVVYNPNDPKFNEMKNDKVVYLTFDDGPGQYTSELLDILSRHNVKATFFVTAQFKKYLPLIKKEHDEGHKVAVHTLTHKWSVYSSVETYIKDFNDMNNIIEEYTGEKTNIFRFPGGSSNTISRKYSKGIVKALASKMTEDGYIYVDWNVDSEDAALASSKKIYNNVTRGINSKQESVVLMHDIKPNTIETIEAIIDYALANGFTFKTIDENTPTIHHYINN